MSSNIVSPPSPASIACCLPSDLALNDLGRQLLGIAHMSYDPRLAQTVSRDWVSRDRSSVRASTDRHFRRSPVRLAV
jgi:hypothetical protein